MVGHIVSGSSIVVVGFGCGGGGGGGGVGGLILFCCPDAGQEFVHVHGAEVLAALAEGMLELIEREGVDGGLSSERREGVVFVLLVGLALGDHVGLGDHHLCHAEEMVLLMKMAIKLKNLLREYKAGIS
jgi:hypothetical protein